MQLLFGFLLGRNYGSGGLLWRRKRRGTQKKVFILLSSCIKHFLSLEECLSLNKAYGPVILDRFFRCSPISNFIFSKQDATLATALQCMLL